VRRLLLVNALIFAVLAAAVALAYYSYSAQSAGAVRERERQLLHDLAEEKVANIESLIDKADTDLLSAIELDSLDKLEDQVRASGAGVASVSVLDDQLKLLPGGSIYSTTRSNKDAAQIRDWFLANVVPKLPLAKQPLGKRGHASGLREGKPYVLSYARKASGDRTFYIVIEDDLVRLVGFVFPQFFEPRTNAKRLYQVADDRGGLVYGPPFTDTGGVIVEVPFVDTVDGWVLRVAEKDLDAQAQQAQRRVFDSLLIGGAVTVILAGLGFLAIAIRRERRANLLKSDFISNVSHELKTPLSIISMFGEMLAEGRTKSPEQAHEYAEIIWRESVRLGRLIDNVLDFAKIERGMGVYEFAEADLGEVIDRAIELSARRVAAADMTLEADIAPELPVMQLDASAFTLAVLNLIDNAIKYAAAGKRIALAVLRDGDRIELTVRDWGPGIDPEEHDRIFDRFYRARAIRLAPIRGSGIGLALVQHIARAHGGDASVTSVPGQGATFHLSLPVIDA